MSKYRVVIMSVAVTCLAFTCAFIFIGQVEASPAAPVEFTITQPDGTTFTARQWGDEYNNGIETIDGYSILQMTDGWWAYASLQGDGLLGPALVNGTALLVGKDTPFGLDLHLRSSVIVENPHSPAAMGIPSPAREAPQAPTLTNVKTLVLLADFNNVTPTYTPASFQSLMFSTTSSSVRKFFRESSFNNMDIVPAEETCGTSNDGITNWTDLGYAHPNTGGSIGTANYDLVYNVLVANNSCIDFASFDTNSNGYIETSELAIVVVVAGYERAYSTDTPNIWAHQGWLNWGTNGLPVLDGKTIGDYYNGGNYAQFGERHYTHQATIGIMAHEFGHVINWPDLYDTVSANGTSEGVGYWSIMGAGNWNYTSVDGDSPAYPDAWLKWYQGWLTPTAVSGTLNDQAIAQASNNAVAFLLRPNTGGVDWHFNSHSGTGEFFLVENRQNNSAAGYDDGLPGCGLLVWHVDETVIYDNTANGDETHALVWLEQADGLNELAGTGDRGDTGDPWPGSAARYDFNSGTGPNSNLYSGSASNASVHVEATSCSSSMLADLTYIPPVPGAFSKTYPANTASGLPNSLTLNWDDASTATDYDFCLETPVNGACTTWTTGLTSSQAPVSGLTLGATYEWQARANNGGGSTLANGGALWTFTVSSTAFSYFSYLPLMVRPVDPPAAFGKSSPANGAISVSTAPTLDWADASGATSYEYCYDLTVNGSCTGSWTTTGGTSQVTLPTLPYSTAHEWQVRARNPGGTTEADGGTEWSFTTAAAPAAWTTVTSENFETAIPKAGWAIADQSTSDGGTYNIGRRNCNVHNGGYSGWMVGGGAQGGALGCGATYVNNNLSAFTYGPFNASSATAGEIIFDLYVNSENNYDSFYALVTDNPSGMWYGFYWDDYWAWDNYTVNLSDPFCISGTTSCLGQPSVYIRFLFESDYSNNYAYGAIVDDIVLRLCNASSCVGAPPFEPTTRLRAEDIHEFLNPFLQPFEGLGFPKTPK